METTGTIETIATFLAVLLPLTLSPGPASIALAGLGMSEGIARAMPFYLGMLATAVAIAIAGGFGLNRIFLSYPLVYEAIRYAGIAYILYLACKLIRARPGAARETGVRARAHDGMLLTALNPKFYVLVTVLFSQFMQPGQGNLWAVVLGLTAVLAFSQFVWLAAGASLKPLLKSERALRIQTTVFGVSLVLVAIYLFFRNA